MLYSVNMKGKAFLPEEIIFSVTQACNLKCGHCYVSKNPIKLDIEKSKKFLSSCINTSINKIGFSGGEPFLNMDFLCQISKYAVENDFLFDHITTNGDWWIDEADLQINLQKLYDSGYDGKFCLSWDIFHGQNSDRMKIFIKTVQNLFGEDSINIQYVSGKNENSELINYIQKEFPNITVYNMPQCFEANDENAWKSKKWFKEDYCSGPGHIFFVHANGNIATCCGFANENPKLVIGNLNETYESLMGKAAASSFLKICYESGLSKLRKKLRWNKSVKMPGKTDNICTFCDFVCKL